VPNSVYFSLLLQGQAAVLPTRWSRRATPSPGVQSDSLRWRWAHFSLTGSQAVEFGGVGEGGRATLPSRHASSSSLSSKLRQGHTWGGLPGWGGLPLFTAVVNSQYFHLWGPAKANRDPLEHGASLEIL
jgi:hypothetical protein